MNVPLRDRDTEQAAATSELKLRLFSHDSARCIDIGNVITIVEELCSDIKLLSTPSVREMYELQELGNLEINGDDSSLCPPRSGPHGEYAEVVGKLLCDTNTS
jgi:hypothetical protein